VFGLGWVTDASHMVYCVSRGTCRCQLLAPCDLYCFIEVQRSQWFLCSKQSVSMQIND